MVFVFVLCYRLLKFVISRLWQYFSNRIMLENELKQILGDGYKVSYRNKPKMHFLSVADLQKAPFLKGEISR